MNNVITTKCGEMINLRMVINDKYDTHGHTLIIRHINNQQSEIEQLKEDLKVANHKINKKES